MVACLPVYVRALIPLASDPYLFLMIHLLSSPSGTGYSLAARGPCTGVESGPTPQGNLATGEGVSIKLEMQSPAH